MESLKDAVDARFRFLLALPLSLVPRRHWDALENIAPIRRAVIPLAILTFFLAAALFIPAYFKFVEAGSHAAVEQMLIATGWRPPTAETVGTPDQQVGAAQMQTAMTWFSIFTFLFTPSGFTAAYLGLASWIRVISAWFDDARGDPVLTVIDSIVFRPRIKRDQARARQAREELEGVEVADRILTGAKAGLPEAEIVVSASRRKPDWVKGAFIITEERWYRLGEPVTRDTPNGLRTIYPLNEVRDLEVMRRGIPYHLKPQGRDKDVT
jgi:hypothetical protein